MYTGQYILERVKQAGVETVFGVPGDFNFGVLDLIEDDPALEWAGNANELGAAYATDGYARLSGFGMLVTTWGVGELSALNGVAGAFVERTPMVHVVGSPPQRMQKAHLPIHHSFGDGEFGMYVEMARQAACAVAQLDGTAHDADKIDHAVRAAMHYRRPAYIVIPTNVTFSTLIDESQLKVPLKHIVKELHPDEHKLVSELSTALENAKSPAILVDVHVRQYGFEQAMRGLIDRLQVRTFSTMLSKSIVDERKPYYNGMYQGDWTEPATRQRFEQSDLVIRIGYTPTDYNTGSFSDKIPTEKLVDLNINWCTVRGSKPRRIRNLGYVLDAIKCKPRDVEPIPVPEMPPTPSADGPVPHTYFWPWTVHRLLRAGDVALAETGTSAYGISTQRLPSGVRLMTQSLYASIGWSVGALAGAAHAVKGEQRAAGKSEPDRTVLFVGDGSLQLAVQELATLVRMQARNVVIFVINNQGYTIERLLHDPVRHYNDLVPWKHTELLSVLGAVKQNSFQVHTAKDLDKIPYCTDGITLVEVFMNRVDAPESLAHAGHSAHVSNSYEYAPEYNT